MLGALWYDRKVARPAVEDAYARIAKLNGDINSKPGHHFMTNQDVQNELKRSPIDILRQDGYLIEVYGWRAGLPTRTHNYYAVYSDEQPPIFLKHYMNFLDKEELKTMPTIVAPSGNMTDLLTGDLQPSAPGKGGGPRGQRKKEEEGDDKSVLKSEDKSDEPKAEDKKADDKKETENKEDAKKEEDKKAGEKNEAEKKAEEKKDAEKKDSDKKDAENKDADAEKKDTRH
jgi:hypothetical protein